MVARAVSHWAAFSRSVDDRHTGPASPRLGSIDGVRTCWLEAFLEWAEKEARRRGDRTLVADHLALALTRPGSDAGAVVAAAGVDIAEWRDEMQRVLGWNEGGRWEREGRNSGSVHESPADRWFAGPLAISSDVRRS